MIKIMFIVDFVLVISLAFKGQKWDTDCDKVNEPFKLLILLVKRITFRN